MKKKKNVANVRSSTFGYQCTPSNFSAITHVSFNLWANLDSNNNINYMAKQNSKLHYINEIKKGKFKQLIIDS